MRNYFRFVAHLFVVFGISLANAGSYEDFFQAIKQDDAKLVQSLLARGFDPNTPSPDGQHALYLALREPALKIAKTLIDSPQTNIEARNREDESPLMMAALKGHADLAAQLVSKNADVNKPGWTPLHYAATGGHVPIVKLLLEHHAYINAPSPNGTTPLMMAAMYGSAQTVRLLLDEGAEVGLKNMQGMTAIDFAVRAGRKDAAEIIAAKARSQRPAGKW